MSKGQVSSSLEQLKRRVRKLESEVLALYLGYRDPRVPWHARCIIACVVAYALSPIDLIPDFIPVLGYLDDLLIVPFGVSLALRLIPEDVLDEYRQKAESWSTNRPKNYVAASLMIALWVIVIVLVLRAVLG